MSSVNIGHGRWIAMYVSIFDDPLFDGEPLTRREALLWLYANVAWAETRHRIGATILPVPVGSIFITLRALQKEWGWRSDMRVRTFLKEMESEGLIIVSTDAGKTKISICDHSVLQPTCKPENAQKTQSKRSGNAQKKPDHKDFEKERMRGDDPDLDGFEDWFDTYPASAFADKDAAEEAWRVLKPDERLKVIVETPGYFADAVASGRTYPPSPAKFLSAGHWARKRSPRLNLKEQKTNHRSSGKAQTVAVASVSETHEELVRRNIEHNKQSWDGQGRNIGQPTKFQREWARMQASRQLASETSSVDQIGGLEAAR